MNRSDLLTLITAAPWLIEESYLEHLVSKLHEPEAMFLRRMKSDDDSSIVVRGSTAILQVNGPIFPEHNIMTRYFGIGCVSSELIRDLLEARDNPDINRAVLLHNSPGGVLTGMHQAAADIKEIGTNFQIDSYVRGACCSGAYWFASATDKIGVDATARLGSIGIVATIPRKSKDDHYIELVNTASPNKRPDPEKPEGKKVFTAELDALADIFLGDVARNRNMTIEELKGCFNKGGILVGTNAVDASLATEVCSFEKFLGEDGKSISNTSSKKKASDKEKIEVKDDINLIDGKGETIMDLKTLKAEHPEIVAELTAEVTASLQTKIDEEKKRADGLQTKLDATTGENEALSGRVNALEKTDAIRSENDIRSAQSTVLSTKLGASNVPTHLHDKVVVDYTKFVKDGVFDKAAFATAVDAEVKDWETKLDAVEDGFIQGGGSNLRDADEHGTEALAQEEDAVVDSMAATLGLSKKGEDK